MFIIIFKPFIPLFFMSKKIRIFGLKKLFGIGPRIFPYMKTIYQKNSGLSNPTSLVFKPTEYESDDPAERQRMAFEDAKNHNKFYQELIKQGVYPDGTRIKVKRMKHSDAYALEMNMPKIMTVDTYIRRTPKEDKREERGEIKYSIREVSSKIEAIAKKKRI